MKRPPIACSSPASSSEIGRDRAPHAGLRQRGGDGERRALVSARGDRRDNLEDRPAGERRVIPRARRGRGR